VLRGFDQFMNLVLDNTVEINGADRNEIGMVVRTLRHREFCLCDDASAQELLTILLFPNVYVMFFI
jgi:small nuclear ribonucleoprotein (snRNP)-like protein